MTEPLMTWSNLTALRAVAKKHGVVRPNTKQIPELLEELARLDIAVSEVCEEEMAEPIETVVVVTVKDSFTVETATEKVTEEPESAPEKVTEEPETPAGLVIRLTKGVNELIQALADKRMELAEATKLNYAARSKPRTTAELIREQKEQDAKARENAKTVNAVAQAQKNFLAGRADAARENMKQLMAEQLKTRG